MSTSLEHSNSGSPWRKRVHEDLMLDLKDFKKPRFNNYRLESESSKTSEEDTESVCSLQAKDTDFVKDTSDTESKSSSNSGDEYEVEVEYDVDSLSENDDIEISTTDSEVVKRMMLAAAAAAICDRSLEAWITDAEDSDSTSLEEPSVERSGFSTCVQCKGENLNPLYRYCEKCFQDRKKYFPPRPRRRRRKKPETSELSQESVKLDMLKYCLSGLSQDSGVSSNQDCPSLGLDRIVIPDHLQLPGTTFLLAGWRRFEYTTSFSPQMSSCTVPVAPAPPALKDLPKVAGDLKTELEGFSSSKLKNAETQEKIILPSAEDVAQEKTHNALIAGVENFNCSLLKRTDTKEKIVLPNAQDVAAEKTEKALIEGIAKFDQAKLKHTETQEKNPLPDKDVVQQEKTHQNLLSGVEHFDKSTMKHTETSEKVILPNTDVIEQEKTQNNLLSGIENFDSTKLKHAETREKNPLPTKETIELEKSA